MSKLSLMAIDKKDKKYEKFRECGKEGCKNKVVIQILLPDKIKGLKVDRMFPLCREHLEEMYKAGFFDGSLYQNHLLMIEGIIKYGSIEKWLIKKEQEKK